MDFILNNLRIGICLVLVISSCKCKDEELTINRHLINNVMSIRLNGYYHRISSDSSSVGTLIFYNDGSFYHFATQSNKSHPLLYFENIVLNNPQDIINNKMNCGVYELNTWTARMQYWAPSKTGSCWERFEWAGNFTSDSSIEIMGKKYHFKQFVKPDSINNFIK